MSWKLAALTALSLSLIGAALSCGSEEFECTNVHQCIPLGWLCDGVVDCRDKTDEATCNYVHPCPTGMYNCQDGDCVQGDWKCDGTMDCHNGRDEESCGHLPNPLRSKSSRSTNATTNGTTSKIAGTVNTETTNQHLCNDHQFACAGGACINLWFKCDGQQDCPLGDDEANCDPDKIDRCPDIKHRKCRTGECVPASWFCDGERDCEDGSDEEEGCENVQIVQPTKVTEPAEPKVISSSDNSTMPPAESSTSDSNDKASPATNEKSSSINVAAPTCAKGQYQCKRSHTCIDGSRFCDGITDCVDGDDEDDRCTDCGELKCQFGCRITLTESYCTCPPGMVTDPQDFHRCIADNPCLHQTHCAHFCKPAETQSYVCSCDVGYKLAEDFHQCVPQIDPLGGELLFSIGNEIRVSSLHADANHASRYNVYSSLDSGENLYHLAMDTQQNRVWAGVAVHGDEWQIARTDNGRLKALRVGLAELGSVQYDWINRNVYFLTGGRRHLPTIHVCNENMLFCSKLIQDKHKEVDQHGRIRIKAFKGLALHPRRGLMCWIEIFNGQTKVKCANMDGSDVHTVIDTRKLVDPTALVWDTLKNDLYVADAGNELIERINYDSREVRVIGRALSPYAMTFFNGMLYYSETEMNTIRAIDVSTDHHLMPHIERIFSSKPFGLTVNHTLAQSSHGVEACPEQMECSYACVSYTSHGNAVHSCICPEGYELGPDNGCTTSANLKNLKVSSVVAPEYMQELCSTSNVCGDNGMCVPTKDDKTGELVDVQCECNAGFKGLTCELTDGTTVARGALEGHGTSFMTVILLILVFIILLALCFFCMHENHQPFRDFTRTTKDAVMESSPKVLQAIRSGAQNIHHKVMRTPATRTPPKKDSSPYASSFSSPVFDAEANDTEAGIPLVKKVPISTASPSLVNKAPVPPVPLVTKSVFANFENPSFSEAAPSSFALDTMPLLKENCETTATHRSSSEPESHIEEGLRNVY